MYLTCFIIVILGVGQYTSALCPPTGPVLPPPAISDKTWSPASLEGVVDSFIQSSTTNLKTTFFSVSVTSRDDTIFSRHYTPKAYNNSGTHEATGSSSQRVASITKIFTVLAMLLQGDMNLDDPITRYIPELSAQERWHTVTLRMLAAQHGGIARDVPAFDLATTAPLPFQRLGFPHLNNSQLPKCDGGVTQPMCSRKEWFNILLDQGFVWIPGDRAAYSDLGFILLGYAIENATGRPYSDVIKHSITIPLGLHSTGFDVPDMATSIIPQKTPWFGFDLGNFDQAAGLYTTTDDLCAFLRAILNGKLLSNSRVREWLKPAIFTSSPLSSVGMPWEIFRVTELTPRPRPVDLFTKDGDLPAPGGYAAHVAMIPEYDVGIVITGAGDYAFEAVTILLNAIGGRLIKELEHLARTQADSLYAGCYVPSDDTLNDSQLILQVDDGPGVKVSQWLNNGADMLQSLADIMGDGSHASDIDARIYPIGEDGRWRLQIEDVSDAGSPYNGPITGQACWTWSNVDKLRYGMLPVDEVDFYLEQGSNGSSVVNGVELVGLRKRLMKLD